MNPRKIKDTIKSKVDSKKLANSLKRKIADAFNSEENHVHDWSNITTILQEATESSIIVNILAGDVKINSKAPSRIASKIVEEIATKHLDNVNWTNSKISVERPEENYFHVIITPQKK